MPIEGDFLIALIIVTIFSRKWFVVVNPIGRPEKDNADKSVEGQTLFEVLANYIEEKIVKIMGAITHSIEINAPVQEVYYLWTRFEEFPRFMEGVEDVRRHGPNRLFWKAKIGGKEKQWEAEITEQLPNQKIAWQSVDGTPNAGSGHFCGIGCFTNQDHFENGI